MMTSWRPGCTCMGLGSALSLFLPQFLPLHPESRLRCSSQSWSALQENVRESFSVKSAVPKLRAVALNGIVMLTPIQCHAMFLQVSGTVLPHECVGTLYVGSLWASPSLWGH